MRTDPITGMPKLPPNYIWRVYETFGEVPGWRVALVYLRKTWLGMAEEYRDSSPYMRLPNLNRDTLVKVATAMWESHFGGEQSLLGDYPPRKL